MDRLIVFRDEAGEHRWHKIAPNEAVVSSSGEGFTERNDAAEAALRANPEFQAVEYEEDAE